MRTGSSTLNYLLGDHLGSTAITTNSSGVRTAEIRYYPWGTTRYIYGTSPTTYQYTGQRVETSLGLLFYNARWYDSSLGRFIQADTIVPGEGNSQAYDRYAYTLNNPLRYTDPSGHLSCNANHVADGNCSDYSTIQILQEFYGITLEAGNLGEFLANEISAIYSAVQEVGEKFSQIFGGELTSGEAFKKIYNRVTFLKGNRFADGGTGGLSSECSSITSGGCTSGTHLINFASMAGGGYSGARGMLRNRNNVVHELGHAFNSAIGGDAYKDLGIALAIQPDLYGRGNQPVSYGFASPFGTLDWQMSFTNASTPNEIFADQFLGWTFDTWGDLTVDQAEARSNWMKDHMANYLGGE